MRKFQPLIEINVYWENVIPQQNKTMCATIIGTPEFTILYNLLLPIKQHGALSHNI